MNAHRPHQPTMDNSYDAQIRRLTPPNASGDFFGGSYPGLGAEFPPGGNFPVPYEGGGGGGGLFNLGGGGGGSSSNPLSGINFNQIKGVVERMGGIDGIIGTMTKVQKFMGTFRQMAPMLKVLFKSFGGKVKSTNGHLRRSRKQRPIQRKRRRTSPTNRNRPRR